MQVPTARTAHRLYSAVSPQASPCGFNTLAHTQVGCNVLQPSFELLYDSGRTKAMEPLGRTTALSHHRQHLHSVIRVHHQVNRSHSAPRSSASCISHRILATRDPPVSHSQSMLTYQSADLLHHVHQMSLLRAPNPLKIVEHQLTISTKLGIVITSIKTLIRNILQRFQCR